MKKHTCKRLLAGASALAFAFSLTACGGDNAGQDAAGDGGAAQQTTASAGETVAAAVEKLAAAKSMTMSMEQKIAMSIDMQGQKQEINTVTQAEMSLIQDPLTVGGMVKMDLGADMGGEQTVEMYLMPADSGVELYMNTAGQWMKQPLDSTQAEAYIGQYDAAASMNLYLDSATDFAEAGQDGDMTKYTGVIKGENLQKVMEESGMLDSLGSLSDMGLSEEQVKGLFDDLGNLDMAVWIDAAGYPVQYEMDMTEMVSGMMDGVMELAGAAEQGVSMTVSAATAKISCASFDGVSEITLPDGAASATEVTGLV